MKKILALMMAFVLGFAFTSCEKADDDISTKIVGKWLAYKAVDDNGTDVSGEVIQGVNQYLIFNTGGKGEIRIERQQAMAMVLTFDWTIEGTTVTMHSELMENDNVYEVVSVTSDELVIEQEGGKMYLKKV